MGGVREENGCEPQILENEEARLLKKFADDMPYPSHCQYCQGLDLSNPNPVHHPSYELTPACNHDRIFCYSNVAVKLGKAPKPGYYIFLLKVSGRGCSKPDRPFLTFCAKLEQ